MAEPSTATASAFWAAHQRQVAPAVAQPLLLLERGVVLLVDHHHPQVAHRGEHRRAGAQRDAHLAGAQPAPGRPPLGRGQPAVQHRHVVAEARPEARGQLRGQRNLRHQHQGAPALPAGLGDQAQVDLGLARAGHPLQHEGRERPCSSQRRGRALPAPRPGAGSARAAARAAAPVRATGLRAAPRAGPAQPWPAPAGPPARAAREPRQRQPPRRWPAAARSSARRAAAAAVQNRRRPAPAATSPQLLAALGSAR